MGTWMVGGGVGVVAMFLQKQWQISMISHPRRTAFFTHICFMKKLLDPCNIPLCSAGG